MSCSLKLTELLRLWLDAVTEVNRHHLHCYHRQSLILITELTSLDDVIVGLSCWSKDYDDDDKQMEYQRHRAVFTAAAAATGRQQQPGCAPTTRL